MKIGGSSQACEVVGNEIAEGGEGGVMLVGDVRTQAKGTLVAGNWIHDCGRIYKHVAGVYGITASETHVAYNRIERMPRYGISFKCPGDDMVSEKNTIEYNRILQTNLETNDTGAIETLGRHLRDTGNIIRYNYIQDVVGMKSMPDGSIKTPFMTWGVYLDDFSSGTTVAGNIIVRTQWGAVCVHGGANNVIENNIMVEGADSQLRYQPRQQLSRNNRCVRNVFYYANDKANIFGCNGRLPRTMLSESDHNLFWHARGAAFLQEGAKTPHGTWKQWQGRGMTSIR